jgi:putative ABC transport system permease protein
MIGLFDIAFKNIKRNFNNYFLYFASMIFSILIYFTFTTIQYNPQISQVVGSSAGFSTVFKSAAIVIAIFVAIFIWYSNSFFLGKRKKEVALYSLLGIRKKHIARMLFYENMVMGITALVAGILLGSLFSKLFIMLLMRLMGFSDTIIFMIPLKAVLNTAIVFTLLFLITSILGYRLIYRFKLIELFKAESQGEIAPKPSIIRSIASVLLIGGGYWIYTKGLSIFSFFSIFITLGLTVIGTFMLFSSLTPLMIKLSKKNERRYFTGINMIRTSQLLFRMNGSARTLAIITILSAATLTAMGVSSSFYYDLSADLQKNYGFTYAYASNDKSLDKKVEATMAKYPKNKLISSVDMNLAKVHGQYPSATKESTSIDFYILSESNYNEIAKVRGLKDKIKLKDRHDVAVFEQYITMSLDYKDYIGKVIKINGDMPLKVRDFKTYSLPNSGMTRRVVVVNDEVYQKYHAENNVYRIKGYITDHKKESEELTKELTSLLFKKNAEKEDAITFSSYYSEYKSRLAFSGVTIFIGALLGLLFLAATGSIIFFKQLSEANDDKNRYEILRKIGATNREIKASIRKQILIVFALPLIFGIMHSIVATTLLSRITIININLTLPISITITAYTVIYMIYYFLTVRSYCTIINSK